MCAILRVCSGMNPGGALILRRGITIVGSSLNRIGGSGLAVIAPEIDSILSFTGGQVILTSLDYAGVLLVSPTDRLIIQTATVYPTSEIRTLGGDVSVLGVVEHGPYLGVINAMSGEPRVELCGGCKMGTLLFTASTGAVMTVYTNGLVASTGVTTFGPNVLLQAIFATSGANGVVELDGCTVDVNAVIPLALKIRGPQSGRTTTFNLNSQRILPPLEWSGRISVYAAAAQSLVLSRGSKTLDGAVLSTSGSATVYGSVTPSGQIDFPYLTLTSGGTFLLAAPDGGAPASVVGTSVFTNPGSEFQVVGPITLTTGLWVGYVGCRFLTFLCLVAD